MNRLAVYCVALVTTLVVGCADAADVGPTLGETEQSLIDDDHVRISYSVHSPDAKLWSTNENGNFATRTNAQSPLVAQLHLLHGCALDWVEVVAGGGNSHLAMPEGLPTVELVRHNLVSHSSDIIAVTVDQSATVHELQFVHSIVVDIDDMKVDATRERYHVVFKSEYGTNASPYSNFIGVRHRCAPSQ